MITFVIQASRPDGWVDVKELADEVTIRQGLKRLREVFDDERYRLVKRVVTEEVVE